MNQAEQIAASMNERLAATYRSMWPEMLKQLSTSQELSWPHLMHVPPAYLRSRVRVVVVGQQPYEWCWKKGKNRVEWTDNGGDTVSHLMREYEQWKLGLAYSKSPFWTATHQIAAAVLGADESVNESVLWTNVYKIDMRNAPPPKPICEYLINTQILRTELEIVKPDAVVFFTGPNYDWAIRHSLNIEFDGANRTLSIVDRGGVKWLRTYHPHYLRRSRNWGLVDQIVSEL
jgi:hypothetical protein